MKRRSFIQSVGALGALTLMPFKSLFELKWTKPVYEYAHSVGVSSNSTTLFEFNQLLGYSHNTDAHYVRCVSFMKAADNVKEIDIVNEFLSKQHDDKAILTTVSAEGDYKIDPDSTSSFREHLNIGQIKELIARMEHHSINASMDEYKEVGGRYPRKWRHWVEDRKVKTHIVRHDTGKENYTEYDLYSINTFAKEMVGGMEDSKLPENIVNKKERAKNLKEALKNTNRWGQELNKV